MSADPAAESLRRTPPFDRLPGPLLEAAARAVEPVSFPAGTRLLTRGGAPSEHLFVIREGAVRLQREGQTLQLLEDGEIFGFTSLLSGQATLDVVVEEPLTAWRLPAAAFQALLADPGFAAHFTAGLADRLRASLDRSAAAGFQPDLAIPVGDLVREAPARLPIGATAGEAARLMTERRVSSVLVDGPVVGMVTDRDLAARVLAAGRGPEAPLAGVMTAPLRPIPEATPVYEAWRILLDQGVRHLPVARGDEIVGVISATDLLRCTASGPVAVLRRVERLPGREALPGYAHHVSEMARALFAGGLEPALIGGFVARLNDALVGRILRWAEADLGPPPCPYAWLAFGSEGRMEQLLLTDQDNAVAFADDTEEARDYFGRLAERAVADLTEAGFPPCPGGFMATRWRGPLEEWEERFATWLDQPTPQALLEASILFDLRRAHGALPVDALRRVVARAGRARVFLAAMAKSALTFRPPGGLMLRLRGESSRVDLKLQAISPIVFLARVYGLEVLAGTSNTVERLRAASAAGLIGEDTLETLTETYRFLLRLRLREQLRMLEQGRPVQNVVAMGDLSSIERSRLRDAFRAIEAWQERAAFHFKTETF
jgi:CBS domain-containing protein